MAKNKNTLVIEWAVDILDDKRSLSSGETLLQSLSKKNRLEVEPVYVVRLSEQVTPLSYGEGRKIFLENVKNAMGRALKHIKIPLREPMALLQNGVYLRSDIDALVSHAKKNRADFILVNTHARKGLSRFWMGSFAETLMHHSSVPVLFLNPTFKAPKNIKTVFCPTSISASAKKGLFKAAEFASSIGAELLIYNNIEYFVATPGLSFTETMVFTGNVEKDIKSRKKTLDKWAQEIKARFKVNVKTMVDDADVRVSDGITRVSKKIPNCMIAMEAQTGPVMSILVGSTTRKVVREASVPVLVFPLK